MNNNNTPNNEELRELEDALKEIFGQDSEIHFHPEEAHGSIMPLSIIQNNRPPFDSYEDFEAYLKTCFSQIDYIDLYNYLKSNVYGQDEQLLKICACLKAYFNNLCQDVRQDIPYHFILAGPTGCGKTEVFRKVQKYFEEKIPELPVILRDATSLTSEGYVGEGKNYLIRDLVGTNGYGIVFLDEFDKRIIKTEYEGAINFASETQNGLLQMIDGAIMEVESEMGGMAEVDTRNTLFICMGAFEKEQKEEKHPGFNNVNCMPEQKKLDDDGLIEWGCERQLATRFCQIINFNRITDEVLDKIITKYIKEYNNSLGCTIKVSANYKKNIKKMYDERNGTRNIRAMIWRDIQVPYIHIKNINNQYIYLNNVSQNGVIKQIKKSKNA